MSLNVLLLILLVSKSTFCQDAYNGTLTQGFVSFLFQQNDTDLELSGRDFLQIAPNAFSGFSELKRLDLSFNEIESLLDDVFNDQAYLRELNLSNNKLTTLSRKWLYPLHSIQRLFSKTTQSSLSISKHFRASLT